MINNLNAAQVLHDLPRLPDTVGLSDPHDGFLLAMVMASAADILVTGDRRAGLLERGSFDRAQILTPAAFAERL